MNYPQEWPSNLKKLVNNAYKTKKLVDARLALKEVEKQNIHDNVESLKIGILRTFTLETILDYLKLSLGTLPYISSINLGELENIEQELFDNSSKFLKSSPDIIFILWRLEELLPDLTWNVDSMSLETRKKSFDILIERIQKIISQYSGSAPIVFSTISVPEFWEKALHDKHRDYGIAQIVNKVNLFLYENAAHGRIKIFDFFQWLNQNGSSLLDTKMDLFARQPISTELALSFSDALSQIVRALQTSRYKVLAVDLDNTLWGGILGEDGIENLNIGKDYPGNIYWRIQQFICSIKKRGFLIVLLSKNNISDVSKAFELLDMPLKLSDFSLVMANWEPKYKNLMDTAKKLNLGVDSFVFLDDQLFEQEEMNAFIPTVKIISNSGDPLNMLDSLINSHIFDKLSLEKEDLLRNEDYKNQVNRRALENVLDRETFLKSLHLKANIGFASEANIQRIVQMTNKTNQFNLTTIRHSISSIKKIMSIKSNLILTISLKDKFGDQGIIGLCVAINAGIEKKEFTIDTFLMSCRALGRGAEEALWASLIEFSNKLGYKAIHASYLATNKNMQVANFYNRMGMKEVNSENEKNIKYILNLPSQAAAPEWIEINILE
jgi:FkbH-like protein